jgi:P pilus assembly chaperone PapD
VVQYIAVRPAALADGRHSVPVITRPCTLARIPEEKLRELRRALDGLERLALIKSPTEQVITVMHVDRRVRATQYVA